MSKKRLPLIIIFLTSIFSVFYYAININSWKFSFVGDEWPFFTKSVEIANSNLLVNPFSLAGVWGQNPVLFSFYQAFFIKIFGASNIVWRLSTIVLIVPLSVFFFLWIKQLFDQKIAIVSTLLLQTSFYLANFLKIGYPNPLALVLFIITIYFFTRTSINLDYKTFILSGMFLGISFYVYIGAIFPLIILPYIIILFWNRFSIKKLVKPFILTAFSYLTMLIPFIIQITNDDTFLKIITEKTVLKKEYTDNLQPIYNFLHNLILFFRNNDYNYNHYVTGPYLEYLTQIFALIGICYLIINLKSASSKLLLTLFISTALVIGLTSPYSYSPTTRGIFFLPFGFAFAGIGMNLVLKRLSEMNYWKFFTVIIIIIFFINLYHSQIGVFKNYNFEPTALITKFLKEEKNKNSKKTSYLIIVENNSYNYENIEILRQAYDLEKIPFKVKLTSEINCTSISGQNVLLLKRNEDLIEIIKKNKCPFLLKII
ncbi:MAG: glycosyltransferase family 39 protein [Patescibacteria group bacterium]